MQHAMYLPCRGSHLILFSCSCNNLSLAEAGVGSNVSGPEGRPIKGVAHVMKLHQCRKSSDDALIASGVVVGRKAFRVFELRRSPGPIVKQPNVNMKAYARQKSLPSLHDEWMQRQQPISRRSVGSGPTKPVSPWLHDLNPLAVQPSSKKAVLNGFHDLVCLVISLRVAFHHH